MVRFRPSPPVVTEQSTSAHEQWESSSIPALQVLRRPLLAVNFPSPLLTTRSEPHCPRRRGMKTDPRLNSLLPFSIPLSINVHSVASADGGDRRDEFVGDISSARASDLRHRNGDLEPGLSIAALALGDLRAKVLRLERID